MINALTDKSEQMLDEMSPKDLAVTIWSLARLDYPASVHLKIHLRTSIKAVLTKLKAEPYLFESENDPEEFGMIESEIQGNEFADKEAQSANEK